MFLQFLKAFTNFVKSPWVNNNLKYIELNAEIIQMLHRAENNFNIRFYLYKYTFNIPENQAKLINFAGSEAKKQILSLKEIPLVLKR